MNKWTKPMKQDDGISPKVLVWITVGSIFAGAIIAMIVNK